MYLGSVTQWGILLSFYNENFVQKYTTSSSLQYELSFSNNFTIIRIFFNVGAMNYLLGTREQNTTVKKTQCTKYLGIVYVPIIDQYTLHKHIKLI